MTAPEETAAPRMPALVLGALVMILDGYDLSAMPLAVPHVARAWGLAPAGFALALSAVLVGLGVGALLIGPVGDRIGRRRAIVAGTVAIGLATLGTATAGSVTAFVLWRLLTGLALGACLPNVTALSAELAAPGRRAATLTIVSCGVPIGGAMAGLIAPPLVALGGWQALFVAPGLIALLLAAAAWPVLPDTRARRGDGLPVRPWALLAAGRGGATLLFVGLYTANAALLYMLIAWLPTVLPGAGFSLASAARLAALLQAGGLIGGLLLSLLLDRGRAVLALAGSYIVVALVLAAFQLVAPDPWSWGAMLVLAGAGISGVHMAIMAMGSGLYPSAMLSAAIGLAVAVARLGAIAGPLAGGWLIAHGTSAADFFAAMLPIVGLCLVLTMLFPRVRRHGADPAV